MNLVPPPAVKLADIQAAERQKEAEEAERRALLEAQMAELEAIERRRRQQAVAAAAASWTTTDK